MTKSKSDTIVMENLDPGFRDEVSLLPGGANIKKCYACGTCAAGCPVTSIDADYNCRSIIRKVLYGMREEVLKAPELWLCVMCYRCYARCPQQVNFTDIMRALRFLAVRDGYAPAKLLAKEDEFDRKAHTVRHDLIKAAVVEKVKIVKKAAPATTKKSK